MENNDMVDLAEPIGHSFEAFEQMAQPQMGGGGNYAAPALIQVQGREVTARKVALPRKMDRILQEIKAYCASFGDIYYYSWEANDRKNKRKSLIEGGTIKLANMLVSVYGNCATDCDVHETQTHWVFKAWFIDYEKGTATPRLFQQRKSQDTGMRDADRQADIIFQIGQSKAIRNAVLNALASLTDFALEESKNALLEKFKDKNNVEKAHAFIDKVMDHHQIALVRVEAVVGRKRAQWTVQNLARVYAEMRGIHEGMTIADAVYPSEQDAALVQAEKDAKDADGRKPLDKETPASNQTQRQATQQNGAANSADTDLGNIPDFLDRRKDKPQGDAAPVETKAETEKPTETAKTETKSAAKPQPGDNADFFTQEQ